MPFKMLKINDDCFFVSGKYPIDKNSILKTKNRLNERTNSTDRFAH